MHLMSSVMCHMSQVKYISIYIFFYKVVELVSEGSLIKEGYPVYISRTKTLKHYQWEGPYIMAISYTVRQHSSSPPSRIQGGGDLSVTEDGRTKGNPSV